MSLMLSWKDIVQKYITGHSDKICKVTRPLHERLGVVYFTYHKIDLDGRYTVLVDRPDWAEHYVEHEFYKEDPFLRHPSMYSSGFTMMNNQGSQNYQDTVIAIGKNVFNLESCVMLIEKEDDHVEFFGFSIGPDCTRLQNVYLNHKNLLRSFATHFKKELRSPLEKMEEEADTLISLKGDDYFNKELISPELSLEDQLSLYEEFGNSDEIALAEKLSKREKQCLSHMLTGCSAKETAALLKLSPRTIESYFENIKNKLACNHKSDLFRLSSTLKHMGLLP